LGDVTGDQRRKGWLVERTSVTHGSETKHELRVMFLDHRQQQPLFARGVVIQDRARYAGPVGDLPHRYRLGPELDERGAGAVKDPLAPFGFAQASPARVRAIAVGHGHGHGHGQHLACRRLGQEEPHE
jgi:hypothetical protein